MCQTSGCLETASFKSKLQKLSDATSSQGAKEEEEEEAEEELSVISSAKQSKAKHTSLWMEVIVEMIVADGCWDD